MPDLISQYDGRQSDHHLGWRAAIVLSAGFHLAMFVFLFWILPALVDRVPAQEKDEVVIVRLLEEVPPPPEVVEPKKFVQEPLESPTLPEQDVLNEILPPEDKTPAPPPEIAKTEAPPPKVTPPKVEVPKTETPRPKPTPTAAKNSGPQAISGLSEAAASRLLGQSLGYEPGQVVASPDGLVRDEEVMRYMAAVRKKLLEIVGPIDSGMGAGDEVKFDITIETNGLITKIQLIQSSGNRDLDRSVEKALRKASPLPPLPASLGGQSGTITAGFKVN